MTADLAPEARRTHELAAFIETQLDKREAAAKAVLAENAAARACGSASTLWEEEDARARQDLRDLGSKRRILAKHQPGRYGECEVCDVGAQSCGCCGWGDYPCDTVRLLAEPYDDHDNYKEDWRP